MDFGIISKILGLILIGESICMTPICFLSAYHNEGYTLSASLVILFTFVVGLILLSVKSKTGHVRYREGFMIVTFGWILASLFGALQFYVSGVFGSFVDCFFETTSGFTTTGASVMTAIEGQPYGILFWRSFTHWLGGMGIIVFTMAILPMLGMGTIQMFKAESPGPTPGRLVPRIGQTAKILYKIYLSITIAEILLLKIAGVSWFDSFTHAFATMGTGGFSTKNASVGGLESAVVEWIVIVFMLLAGTNFALYYEFIRGKFKTFFKDSEFRFYLSVVLICVTLVTINIIAFNDYNFKETIRMASFQVVSIISTTGFTSVDYSVWPQFSKFIILILMFIGGCAGSTGGSIKCIRVLLILKYVKRELFKLIHPKSVSPIRLGSVAIPREVMRNVVGLALLFIFIFIAVSAFLLSQGYDTYTSTSATIACLGNIGPGFSMVGPAMNYAGLNDITKLVLSMCMIMGRLEVYTVLVIFIPEFWKR